MEINRFLTRYCSMQILPSGRRHIRCRRADGVHGVVQDPTVAVARGGEILCPLNK